MVGPRISLRNKIMKGHFRLNTEIQLHDEITGREIRKTNPNLHGSST